jgi:hypothetical protein
VLIHRARPLSIYRLYRRRIQGKTITNTAIKLRLLAWLANYIIAYIWVLPLTDFKNTTVGIVVLGVVSSLIATYISYVCRHRLREISRGQAAIINKERVVKLWESVSGIASYTWARRPPLTSFKNTTVGIVALAVASLLIGSYIRRQLSQVPLQVPTQAHPSPPEIPPFQPGKHRKRPVPQPSPKVGSGPTVVPKPGVPNPTPPPIGSSGQERIGDRSAEPTTKPTPLVSAPAPRIFLGYPLQNSDTCVEIIYSRSQFPAAVTENHALEYYLRKYLNASQLSSVSCATMQTLRLVTATSESGECLEVEIKYLFENAKGLQIPPMSGTAVPGRACYENSAPDTERSATDKAFSNLGNVILHSH